MTEKKKNVMSNTEALLQGISDKLDKISEYNAKIIPLLEALKTPTVKATEQQSVLALKAIKAPLPEEAKK
jgi:hypothetical protein